MWGDCNNMLGSVRACRNVFAGKRMMQQSLPLRQHYDTDVMIRKFKLFEYHSPNSSVLSDDGKVVSIRLKWPLEDGVVEGKDEITIPTSTREFSKLTRFDYTKSHTTMVYIWYAIDDVGIQRGHFTLTRPDGGGRFLLSRQVPVQRTVKERAQEVADDVMSKFQTEQALYTALNDARNDFGDSLLNLPLPGEKEDSAGTSKKRPLPIPPSIKAKHARVYEVEDFNGHSRPTTYNGVRFKSLAEARFSRLLDILKINHSYETMTFRRPDGGRYTPDFFLPAQQLIVEYKPARPLIEEEVKCEEMSRIGFRVVCMYGDSGKLPFAYEHETRRKRGKRFYGHKDGLRGIAWDDGEKLAGEVVFVSGKSTRSRPSPLEFIGDTGVPHLDTVCSSTDERWKFEAIQSAVNTIGGKDIE